MFAGTSKPLTEQKEIDSHITETSVSSYVAPSTKTTKPAEQEERKIFPEKRMTTCGAVMGRLTGKYNPTIPHVKGDPLTGQFLLRCWTGMSALIQECAAEAKHSGKGVVQASMLHLYMLFVFDPELIQQIKFNRKKLLSEETGGVQEKFFGNGTIVSLPSSDPRYLPQRRAFLHALFSSVRDYVSETQRILDSFINELESAAENKIPVDLQDLGSRIALSVICQTQLGFKSISLTEQRALIKIVNGLTQSLSNPANSFLVALENTIKHSASSILPNHVNSFIGKSNHKMKHAFGLTPLSLTPHLDYKLVKGEKILIKLIKQHQDDLFEKIKLLSNNDKLKKEDLTNPESLGLIKLILAGGFETTGKAIRDALVFMQDPANKAYNHKVQEELARAETLIGKKVGAWDEKDLTTLLGYGEFKETSSSKKESKEELDPTTKTTTEHIPSSNKLEHLCAFIFEVLRLRPPFANLRNTVTSEFRLSPGLPLCKTQKEYDKAFAERKNPEEDIIVPKDTFLVTSRIDAHQYPKAHGEDAHLFNPYRWIGIGFNLIDVMKHWNFGTFGNDERTCPGRRFSEQELILFLARVFMQFTLRPVATPTYDPGFTLELAKKSQAIGEFALRTEPKEVKSFRLGGF